MLTGGSECSGRDLECSNAISSVEARFRMLKRDSECSGSIPTVGVRFRVLKFDSGSCAIFFPEPAKS